MMNILRKDPKKVAYDQGQADARAGRAPVSIKNADDEVESAYKEGYADELLTQIRKVDR